MSVRSSIATAIATGAAFGAFTLLAAPVAAQSPDQLCKPGHVLDAGRQLCYDPTTAYRPNLPEQQSILGGSQAKPAASNTAGSGSPAAAPATSSSSSSSSGGGFFGWLGDQARFCRYGDKQVGSGDAAYCVSRDGKTYPAGK